MILQSCFFSVGIPGLFNEAGKTVFGTNPFDFNPDLIANFGTRDKDNKTLDAGDAVSLASDILDCYIVDLAFFKRNRAAFISEHKNHS